MEEVGEKGIPYAIAEARKVVGTAPTYFTFDIDSIDPAFAPGTGTPEIGGFTSREALQLVRGFRHLNLVGADMVEVSPPLDQIRQHGAGRRLHRVRAALPAGRGAQRAALESDAAQRGSSLRRVSDCSFRALTAFCTRPPE